jgi:hypothetical protein
MALIPSNPEDTREVVSAMRFKLGFSLAMSKDGSHFGGRFVRKNRNVVERDNARATGDGCPRGVDESSRRGSISTTSYVR